MTWMRPDIQARASQLQIPRYLRRRLLKLSAQARLYYVVSLLLADDDGSVPKVELANALADPAVMKTARGLAAKWRLL